MVYLRAQSPRLMGDGMTNAARLVNMPAAYLLVQSLCTGVCLSSSIG